MAIDAYTGLPGHGKSYGVVEHVIIPSLKQNRLVVTNIPLAADDLLMDFGGRIEQLPADWFERADLAELAPPGAVLVLDELWRRWPNGMKASEASVEDKALLAEHRHRVDVKGRSMRVVLVTQDLAQIASWVRLLVETTYRMRKLSKKTFLVDIYRGAVTGPRPPKSSMLRQAGGRFKAEVFRYYQSATQSQSGDVGDESKADGRASLLRSWGLWGLILLIVVGLIVGVVGISRFFSPERFTPPEPVAAPVAAPIQTPQSQGSRAAAQVYKTKPDGPVMSQTWRVGGHVMPAEFRADAAKVSFVVLVSNAGGRRVLPITDCRFFPSGRDVFCDVDGERVTPWTGRGAVTTVIDPLSLTGTSAAPAR
ncbi:zonular occludens toxin domain-containing protein [Pseudomonas mangrovi]|uniref:Zona occludens toxin N-terminal domain-containing protein n=1 Tax=Pseudomonas mangrovi TaxID=2161748 RepID=A0A2T5P4Z2_9PSED|nr:zonular occludens toxin domain-containing protein [Pseudomonas mangrovi]PTU72795.1 hypothetical protein DBO85_18770 [Pseudomonas mangrovi]